MNRTVLVSCILLPLSILAQEPDKILLEGRAALRDGVYEFAQKQFELYLKTKGDKLTAKEYEEVNVLLIRTFYEQKKYDNVLNVLALMDAKKIGDQGLIVFWRALIAYETGRFDEALKEINDFENKYPSSLYIGRSIRLTAWCCLKKNRVDLALNAFARFDEKCEISPEKADNLLEWARTLIADGKIEKADEVLSRLLKFPQESASIMEGRLWYSRIQIGQGKFEGAVNVLVPLTEHAGVAEDIKAQAWYEMAFAYDSLTNRNSAIAALSNGMNVARSPEIKQQGALRMGSLYLNMGQIDKAVPILKSYISQTPSDPRSGSIQLDIADAYLAASMYQQAVEEYQFYIETFTNTVGLASAHYGRGWGLLNIGRNSEAAAAFLKSYDLYTDAGQKERSLFKVGDAYFANEQYKLASEAYERVAKEFPSSSLMANAMFQLAESYARAENYELAESVFNQIVTNYTKSALAEESILRLAEIKESRGLLKDAIDEYSRLMNLYPESAFIPDALHGRGYVYFQQWRFKLALSDFERVVNSFPKSEVMEECYYKRGMCCYWLGQDETALNICRTFIETYPESRRAPEVLFWIGKYYFNHGNYKDAENTFLAFAKRYSKNQKCEDALLWAGRSLAKQKEYVGSIEVFARMIKEFPNSSKMAEVRFAQAESLREIANYAEAILIFDEIINKYPESNVLETAWLRKGDCQFMLGAQDVKRYQESLESYRVVSSRAGARLDFVMEALYKTGRCLEKQGKATEALEYYYQKVILRYFEDRDAGVWHNETSRLWFTRACLNAAGIAESREDWKTSVAILQKIILAGAEAAPEAKERIDKMRSEHWWLFH